MELKKEIRIITNKEKRITLEETNNGYLVKYGNNCSCPSNKCHACKFAKWEYWDDYGRYVCEKPPVFFSFERAGALCRKIIEKGWHLEIYFPEIDISFRPKLDSKTQE